MSHPSRPIVVAIADKQPRALRFAIKEATNTGSPLRVVHSATILPQGSEFYLGLSTSMVDDLHTAGRAVLDAARHLVEELAPDLAVEYVLTDDAPLEALAMQASEARVLILGADDVPWLERLMRTKIAGYLAKHAACPVIVVPEHEFPSGPDGEIVVSLDGDSTAPGPLLMAFEEADSRDCLLHVLHSTPPGTLPADADASRANLADMLAQCRDSFPDVRVLEGFVHEDAAVAVARASRSAELVVVGRPRSHHLPFSLSRPSAVKVLAAARCPVAVVPSDYRGQ